MRSIRSVWSRILAVFNRRRLESTLDDEVRAHLELLTQDYERAGMTRDQARLAARRAFGGVEQMKERHRDRRGLPWLDVLRQDVSYACRQLRRKPGLACTAVLTLGLSIGATVAVFTVVDDVLFRPLTYPDAGRLVVAHSRLAQFGRIPVSDSQFRVWRTSLTSFDGMALLWAYAANLSGTGEPERVAAARVSPELFRILGVRPQLGRLLRDEEDQPGRDRVVMLSDQLWRRRFNADRQIVGRTIAVNGEAHEVVGVLPRDFRFPRVSRLYSIPIDADRPDLWKPFALAENDPFRGLNFAAIGRLASGVTIQQAQTELDTLQSGLLKSQGPGNATIPAELMPLHDQITGTSRRGLEVLLAAVGAVLLIASLNVTNLILARSATRRRELAVRSAVGATRGRLARQLFTEGVVLSTVGGFVGVALAALAVRLLVLNAPVDIPRLDEVRVDVGVLQFAALITMATAVVVGLLPAWRLPRISLQWALKYGSGHTRNAQGRHAGLTQATLMTGQVSATVVCAIVAGLLLQSFVGLLRVDKGFQTENVVTANLDLAGPAYLGRRVPLQRSMIEQLRALPGVTAVGLASQQLLAGTGMNLRVLAEGTSVPSLERPLVNFRTVNPDFFAALGIPIQRGQVFTDTDARPVAVVSASTAARLWPGQEAIGKRFRRGPDNSPPIEVVGVAGDVRASRLEQPAGFMVYVPYWQAPVSQVSLSVKATADAATVASGMREVIRALDAQLPLAGLRTMNDVVAESVSERRFLMSLVVLFAVAAVLLTAVGVYGIVSQGVARRVPEIGLRLALGARRGAVVHMVLREVWSVVTIGLGIGVSIALAGGSALRSVLFDVRPYDARTIAAACFTLLVAATFAAGVPARRAARVDPMVSLRSE
jgi:predicted permease